ncbi:MAG: hypothetical protein WDO18_04360 [Acidobacteriota bacterium]
MTERLPERSLLSQVMHFNYTSGLTFYTRYGDWFPWACLIVSFGAAIFTAVRRPS